MTSADEAQVVLERARELWAPSVADIWMTSPNGHLGGARPVDVLHLRGPAEVLDALEAAAAGAYA